MTGQEPPNAADRFPMITEAGRRRLRWLEEHPQAPRYNHMGVDRLTPDGARRLAVFEAELSAASRGRQAGQVPSWLAAFADFCCREVPAYRAYGAPPGSFFDLPTSDRGDLAKAPWNFLPDSQPLDGLIVFQTSGTTGHPLNIITHPETLAHYLPLLRAALAVHGVVLDPERDDGPQVSLVVVCHQAATYTYAAVSPYLNQAGVAKINLNPADWRDPADQVRFLDACHPRVYTGDPVSLAALANLPLTTRPEALVSTSMMLLPGLREHLRSRFDRPVVDIYSMNEAGPIAVAAPDGGGHLLLQHRLFVEVLDSDGAACPPGARGEVTLTGGFNSFLPLLRYRTGDWARLDDTASRQVRLLDLEGRPPIIFRGAAGQAINNIDVTAVLKPFALPQYHLHQSASGGLRLRVAGSIPEPNRLPATILELFGASMILDIEPFDPAAEGKLLQYTSDLG